MLKCMLYVAQASLLAMTELIHELIQSKIESDIISEKISYSWHVRVVMFRFRSVKYTRPTRGVVLALCVCHACATCGLFKLWVICTVRSLYYKKAQN